MSSAASMHKQHIKATVTGQLLCSAPDDVMCRTRCIKYLLAIAFMPLVMPFAKDVNMVLIALLRAGYMTERRKKINANEAISR